MVNHNRKSKNNSVEQDMKVEMGMDIEPQRATNEKDPKKTMKKGL
ncbi:3-methyladenine DNA glycosylase [Bacillus sp. FJAT-50079]|nr:3-methyladenine DNA glycosylase [Bacillus sp. FJAT-50079]MBS4207866.1 3-methyladenine DNA glycosylase [Bacillus sp. FJAT-50079]